MKYIDAEKLKAEIERLKKDWEAIAEDESEDLTAESMIAEYEHLLLFLDTLEDATYFKAQPSEDLEKEAVSWAGSSAIDAFEAGAEWQKEQMLKYAVDGSVSVYNNEKIKIYTELLEGDFGLKFGDKVKIIIVKED